MNIVENCRNKKCTFIGQVIGIMIDKGVVL